MRVVLDANVLVSGLLSEAGAPGWIVELALAGELVPVFDARILGEYREVLGRRELALPKEAIEDVLTGLARLGVELVAPPWPHPLPDRDDEPFLAVAAAAGAVLVTGNLRHFPPSARAAVSVVTPRELLDRMKEMAAARSDRPRPPRRRK